MFLRVNWIQKYASLGGFHKLGEFYEFLMSSKIFGVRKILKNCENQQFLAILSYFAVFTCKLLIQGHKTRFYN